MKAKELMFMKDLELAVAEYLDADIDNYKSYDLENPVSGSIDDYKHALYLISKDLNNSTDSEISVLDSFSSPDQRDIFVNEHFLYKRDNDRAVVKYKPGDFKAKNVIGESNNEVGWSVIERWIEGETIEEIITDVFDFSEGRSRWRKGLASELGRMEKLPEPIRDSLKEVYEYHMKENS